MLNAETQHFNANFKDMLWKWVILHNNIQICIIWLADLKVVGNRIWEIEEESSAAKFWTGTLLENTFVTETGQYTTRLLKYFLAHHNMHIIHNLINTNIIFILIAKGNEIQYILMSYIFHSIYIDSYTSNSNSNFFSNKPQICWKRVLKRKSKYLSTKRYETK